MATETKAVVEETKVTKKVEEEPKVMIYIPIDPLNKESNPCLNVMRNGKTYRIKRGEYVTVPKGIAEIAAESLKITQSLDIGYYGEAETL